MALMKGPGYAEVFWRLGIDIACPLVIAEILARFCCQRRGPTKDTQD
jgi:hypothetical protein